MKLNTVISECKKGDRRAQNRLFNQYAPILKSICLRYLRNEVDAEDALIVGFYKIFDKINQYQNTGSFEGWMKRIVVNECLMIIRKKNQLGLMVDLDQLNGDPVQIKFEDRLTYEEIINLLEELPTGYRTIFNLYVIEGYKHREIAELLGISINTSKSQLILARKKLKVLLKKKSTIKSTHIA